MEIHNSRWSFTLTVIIGLLAVSTASIFIRFAQQEAPSIVIAALRMVVSTFVLLPLALKNYYQELLLISKKQFLLIILSGLFLALHFATWISSLAYTSIASSVVLVSTGPIWVAIFSKIWLREKQNNAIFLGFFLSFIGLILIALNDSCIKLGNLSCFVDISNLDHSSLLGDILAFIGALMVAGYFLIGRSLRQSISLIPYIFLVYGISAIFLFIFLFFSGKPILGYSSETYLWIILLALIPQTIGHSIYNWALKHISATIVSIFTLGEPIGTTILAIFVFKEYPGYIKLLGILLILGGIYIILRLNRTNSSY
jgi:drug/metabolite transporter (DMT)-like permease